VHVYENVTIGDRVILHSGAVIGSDGFRYVREMTGLGDEPLRHRKFRHVGRVVIEDDVEIGANTTIDRAVLGVTRIGRGTKIDNLVMIGHNAQIGQHCILVAQAGLSGSTRLGDYVVIAGQAGLVDHVTVGGGAVIGAQAGVTKDIGAGAVVLGSPAIEAIRAKKALALVGNLPEFKKTVADHGRRIARLEAGEPLESTRGEDR
jgi:UDP-3-O-[3-hydroxymyristoyl] glucosamine N-acyltransferase